MNNENTFISYAQNKEDVVLWRALKHIENGFYIDVGANDPNQDSVTKAFYLHGWRGINIEPVNECWEKLMHERPLDVNLQVALSSKSGGSIFYEIFEATGLSTFDKNIMEQHKAQFNFQKIIEHKVITKTLTEVCNDVHISVIHFLKIDVEGAEKQVLEGTDFSIIRPWIIVIEATLPNTSIPSHTEWEPIVLSSNYKYVYFDGLNRFYVANEHSELMDSFKIK